MERMIIFLVKESKKDVKVKAFRDKDMREGLNRFLHINLPKRPLTIFRPKIAYKEKTNYVS
jgi:hypothetical protein